MFVLDEPTGSILKYDPAKVLNAAPGASDNLYCGTKLPADPTEIIPFKNTLWLSTLVFDETVVFDTVFIIIKVGVDGLFNAELV